MVVPLPAELLEELLVLLHQGVRLEPLPGARAPGGVEPADGGAEVPQPLRCLVGMLLMGQGVVVVGCIYMCKSRLIHVPNPRLPHTYTRVEKKTHTHKQWFYVP